MDCLHYRDQVLDNCWALFDADVRILTYTRAPLNGNNCIASKLNYHAIVVPKHSAGKLRREDALLGPSHALSRQGAIITLLKQAEEMLGDMLQKREEGGEEEEEEVVEVDNGRDYRREAISANPGLGLNRQHQEHDIKCNSQEPHSAAAPFTMSVKKFGGRFQETGIEVRNREIKSIPGTLDRSISLARGAGTEDESLHSDPMLAEKESVLPQNPRDSEIGIALGARDSSLGAQVGPEWCSWGVGSEWHLRLESQADAVFSKSSLPQAPLVEQGSVATLVETPESRKLQIPTPNPWPSSKSLSTPVSQPLTSPRNAGQVKVTCLTPATHRESFITATEEGMHCGGVSSSSGALSPFSPGYQSTRGETVQYESGTEEGYESEISQTTFATDPGFMTPRSATPTDTGYLDSKQKPAQDLSRLNRALLKTEVELAMKTLLYGLAGQVGDPKGLYWDSC